MPQPSPWWSMAARCRTCRVQKGRCSRASASARMGRCVEYGNSTMSETLQAVRGMNDVLPDQTAAWQLLERAAREIFAQYGYREIRLPLLERTELFKRSI